MRGVRGILDKLVDCNSDFGVFPHIFVAFTILGVSLAIGAWVFLAPRPLMNLLGP